MKNRTTLEKVAEATLRLKHEYDELEKVAHVQQEKLEKRAMAEDILLRARSSSNAPTGLRPSSLEDFLTKRASLEDSTLEHLEKIALMLDYVATSNDFTVDNEASDNEPKRDFNSFLKEIDLTER
ncbi:MAG: hypothetical protein ACR2MS_07940 [Weeksellaceae bacterium]